MPGLKLLQYGESGSGKTVRALRFAEFGPLYVFDFDNKLAATLLWFAAKHPLLRPLVSHDIYRGEEENLMGRVNEKLNALLTQGVVATIVIDSWTQLERTYFDFLMGKYQALGGKNWGEIRQTIEIDKTHKLILPGTADHAMKNRAFSSFIDRLTSLPLNIIVNGHVKEPMTGPITLAASGEISKTLPKYFDEWHYLYTNAMGMHKVRVKPNGDVLANSSRTDVPATGILDKDDLAIYKELVVSKDPPKPKPQS